MLGAIIIGTILIGDTVLGMVQLGDLVGAITMDGMVIMVGAETTAGVVTMAGTILIMAVGIIILIMAISTMETIMLLELAEETTRILNLETHITQEELILHEIAQTLQTTQQELINPIQEIQVQHVIMTIILPEEIRIQL